MGDEKLKKLAQECLKVLNSRYGDVSTHTLRQVRRALADAGIVTDVGQITGPIRYWVNEWCVRRGWCCSWVRTKNSDLWEWQCVHGVGGASALECALDALKWTQENPTEKDSRRFTRICEIREVDALVDRIDEGITAKDWSEVSGILKNLDVNVSPTSTALTVLVLTRGFPQLSAHHEGLIRRLDEKLSANPEDGLAAVPDGIRKEGWKTRKI